jgi:WD40 repeat protein
LGGHDGEGLCLCTVDEDGDLEEDDNDQPIIHPGCPVTGHSGAVRQVEFSDDGTQVISAGDDQTVRFWELASGRQVRQLAGSEFALVEGLSDEHKRGRYILTARGNTLLIYECREEEQEGGGCAAAAPVACFKAPGGIDSVRCHGAAICVGCADGAVCILSAPFLAA